MKSRPQAPEPLSSFLIYIESIQGKSQKTANEYFYDLRTFFRYLKIHFDLVSRDIDFDDIDIMDVGIDILKKVDLNLIYEYMNFLHRVRNNSPHARARKIASLRSFYKYISVKLKLIDENPTAELESVKLRKSLPKYFTVEDCKELLSSIDGKNAVRDYCIITLFLNCGMRLSELVNINYTDIKNDVLTVLGKGNKERTIYLNDACIKALEDYMVIRNEQNPTASDRYALFLSSRNKRISRRTVQTIVEKYVKKIGLDPHKYTTHKLRHTAATLMYQSGVDIRVLQEILGHEQLSTTEIYTHINNEKLKTAVSKNPLSSIVKEEKNDNNDEK